MDRNRPHEIDDRAIAVFQNVKPIELVLHSLNPDYAKDYLVEICDRPKMSGEQAIVQLKGQEKLIPSRCGKFFSFPLESKHAVYYADKVKLPVFLVLVNVCDAVAYWLFVQPYLLETLRGKRWRHRKTVTVRVPAANSFADGSKFLEEIRSARKYMAAHQPAAINAAIAAKRASFESLDPRFNIAINATENGENYTVHAKEVVNLTIGVRGDPKEAKKKLDDLIDRGLPMKFGPEEITVSGSPLFAELFSKGGVLATNREIEVTAALIARDADQRPIARLDEIRSIMRGGPKELRIESQLPDTPLVMKNVWMPDVLETTLSFRLLWDRWSGQTVLTLAYFEQLRSFIDAMRRCASVRFEFSHRGNICLSGGFDPQCGLLLDDFSYLLTMLVRAREIAKRFNINPVVPHSIAEEHIREIDRLHAFITKGELRRRYGKESLKIHMGEPCWDIVEETILKNQQPSTPFTIGCNSLTANLFDHEFPLGEVDIEFTSVVFSKEEKRRFKRRLAKGKKGALEVQCMMTDGCESIIRLPIVANVPLHE